MSVIQLAEPTSDETQTRIYNENIGGNLNRTVTFDSVSAGTCWAVVGCVLSDLATPLNQW
jgi:hypothetical protein